MWRPHFVGARGQGHLGPPINPALRVYILREYVRVLKKDSISKINFKHVFFVDQRENMQYI